MTPVRTAARAMLACVFVVHGAQAATYPGRLAERAKPLTDRIAPLIEKASPKLPTDAKALVRINGVAQIAGGLLLMTPLRRPAAVVLAGSLVPTTLAGHAFWQVSDPTQRAAQRVQFVKNVGLLGGLLLAAVDTGGQPSLRWRTRRLASDTADAMSRSARTATSKARIARRSAAMGRKSATFGRHISV